MATRTSLLAFVFFIQSLRVTALMCFSTYSNFPLRNFMPSIRVITCQVDEPVCYEYEGDAYTQPTHRLVYYAGCGLPDICDRGYNVGNCSTCSTSNCNKRMIDRMSVINRVCYVYSATYYPGELYEFQNESVICPSEETECFQAHFPTGSAYSAWTRVVAGCGNKISGCTHQYPARKCLVCSTNECNAPVLPGNVTKRNFGVSPTKVRLAGAVTRASESFTVWYLMVAAVTLLAV